MRTEEEIREELFIQKTYLETTYPALVSHRSGLIEALEWTLGVEHVLTEEESPNIFIQRVKEALAEGKQPKSREEIIKDMENFLSSPFPFFKYLKDRNAKKKEEERSPQTSDQSPT